MARGNWEEFLRPHFAKASDLMSVQMDRIIDELRLIKGAVRDSGPDPVVGDKYTRRTITGAGSTDLGSPAVGEMWIIESISWLALSDTIPSNLTVGGQPRVFFGGQPVAVLSDNIAGIGFPVFQGESVQANLAGANGITTIVIRRVTDGSVPKRVHTGRSMEITQGNNLHEGERDLIAGRTQAPS